MTFRDRVVKPLARKEDWPPTVKYRHALNQKLVEHKLALAALDKARGQRIDADIALDYALHARKIIIETAHDVQKLAHDRIATVVTRCLQHVFDNPYQFKIVFQEKRNKTEALLQFERDGLTIHDPEQEIGGGVLDVASFALRLACITLNRPPLRKLMVLDEPFKSIRGKMNRDRVRQLLLDLARDYGMQFVICVDHEAYPQFLMGKVVEVGS
jgi:hypothetical protein